MIFEFFSCFSFILLLLPCAMKMCAFLFIELIIQWHGHFNDQIKELPIFCTSHADVNVHLNVFMHVKHIYNIFGFAHVSIILALHTKLPILCSFYFFSCSMFLFFWTSNNFPFLLSRISSQLNAHRTHKKKEKKKTSTQEIYLYVIRLYSIFVSRQQFQVPTTIPFVLCYAEKYILDLFEILISSEKRVFKIAFVCGFDGAKSQFHHHLRVSLNVLQ